MGDGVLLARCTWGTRLWVGFALALVCGSCAAEDVGGRPNGGAGATATVAGASAGTSNAVAGTAADSAGASSMAGTNASGGGAGTSGASGASGGGSGGAGSGTGQDEPCETVGATRACCGIGEQTCAGDGEFPLWGPCMDTGGAPIVECNDCSTNEFGPGCDAGPPEPPPDPPDAGTPDTGPPDTGPPDAGSPDTGPPPTECGPGMECKPGKFRYCDDPAGEWTKSTCDSTGHWGPCIAVPVPPEVVGFGDCSDFDYSPEMCCGPAMICCQDNPGGPWVDFGSGACVEVSCP